MHKKLSLRGCRSCAGLTYLQIPLSTGLGLAAVSGLTNLSGLTMDAQGHPDATPFVLAANEDAVHAALAQLSNLEQLHFLEVDVQLPSAFLTGAWFKTVRRHSTSVADDVLGFWVRTACGWSTPLLYVYVQLLLACCRCLLTQMGFTGRELFSCFCMTGHAIPYSSTCYYKQVLIHLMYNTMGLATLCCCLQIWRS
jgi:hypothetical protein